MEILFKIIVTGISADLGKESLKTSQGTGIIKQQQRQGTYQWEFQGICKTLKRPNLQRMDIEKRTLKVTENVKGMS